MINGGTEEENCKRWRGQRLVCVFSDCLVIGKIVTPGILHRDMKIIDLGELLVNEDHEDGLTISHGDKFFTLELKYEKDRKHWASVIVQAKEERSKVRKSST